MTTPGRGPPLRRVRERPRPASRDRRSSTRPRRTSPMPCSGTRRSGRGSRIATRTPCSTRTWTVPGGSPGTRPGRSTATSAVQHPTRPSTSARGQAAGTAIGCPTSFSIRGPRRCSGPRSSLAGSRNRGRISDPLTVAVAGDPSRSPPDLEDVPQALAGASDPAPTLSWTALEERRGGSTHGDDGTDLSPSWMRPGTVRPRS